MKDNFTPLGLGTSTIASLGRSLTFNSAKKLFDTALDYNIKLLIHLTHMDLGMQKD